MKSIIKASLLFLMSILIFTACDNPIGLGTKVNTEKPVIRTSGDENRPGDFIQGDGNRIWLDVEQEFGIAEVFMEVEYIDIATGVRTRKRIDAVYDESRGQWYVDLDTSDMEDGTITAWVTAIDVDGNRTTTTDIVYFIKNTPPQIKLNMPLVDGDNWDNDDFLDNIKNLDPLFIGFELMGLATDNYGIAEGYPKIMIWPEDAYVNLDADGIPLPDGVNGGLYGTWRSLVVPNARDGLTATKFTWPMYNLIQDASAPGGYRLPRNDENSTALNTGIYRIRIVTKDLFGNENYYPNRTDHGTNTASKKYIEIKYTSSDKPIIQVINYPQYYNGVKDFELYFSASSKEDPTFVTAAIVNTNDGTETIIGGPYTPVFVGKDIVNRYKLTISAAEAKEWNDKTNGIMYVRLRADVGDNYGINTYQNFIFDNTPPEVVIDRPVSLQASPYAKGKINGGAYEIYYPYADGKPKWVTGTIQVGGSAVDDLTLIKKVYYHIGKLYDDKPSADREEIYTNKFPDPWIDTKLDNPTHDINWSGSVYAWTYKFDPFPKNYKTVNSGLVQTFSELDNYSSTFPEYSETDIAGKTRFYLPFYVKVVDSADNFTIIHYKLCVDPDLDDPVINFTQPDANATVGGTVRIGGTAEDNFWMKTVLIRVKKNGSYITPSNPPTTSGYYLPPGKTQFYLANPTYPMPKKSDGVTVDSEGWFETTKIGDSATVNWWVNINQDLALDPSTSGTTAAVTIEAIAIDCRETDSLHNTPNTVGPIEKRELKFSKDVPKITIPRILKYNDDDPHEKISDVEYTDSVKTSGKFTVSFDVKAIDGIDSLSVRINNLSTTIKLIDGGQQQGGISPWVISSKPNEAGMNVRNIEVEIDSETGGGVIPAVAYGKSAELTIEVDAVDATTNHLRSTSTFVIGIDNFYPTALIQTSKVASEDIPNGKLFYVEGNAKDYASGSGPIQGIERVLVYFEHAQINYPSGVRTITGNGNYVKPNGGGTLATTGNINFIDYYYVLNYGTSTTTSTIKWNVYKYQYFPKYTEATFGGKTIWRSNVALVIDTSDAGDSDSDGDGTKGETWGGTSSDREWAARVEFTGWKDGPYIVHYLVMDQAGNASHYTGDFYLENNKPLITEINFGTDINGVGGVTDGTNNTLNEYLYTTGNAELVKPGPSLLYGVQTPAFRIRNNAFSVKLTVKNGNGAKEVDISYATAISPAVLATTMEKGKVYTIVSTGGGVGQTSIDFTKYGAPNNIVGTTFVATGKPDTATNGTVTSYNLFGDTTYGMNETDTSGTFAFKSTNFQTSWDSSKDGNGNITAKNQRFFIIRLRDSTLSNTVLYPTGAPDPLDNLIDAVLVKLDIDNVDSKNPSINVLPFGREYTYNPNTIPNPNVPPPNNNKPEDNNSKYDIAVTNYTRNIGMNSTVEKGGYVQYAANSTDSKAYVSGKVKFLGKAEDNQHIKEISVTISGYNNNNKFKIAQANVSTGYLEAADPGILSGGWTFKIDTLEYLTQDYGHTLNWEFMWDSSKHVNVAKNDVTIQFEVVDFADRKATSSTTVNIVPYISEIVTSLSNAYAAAPSAFSRSALGGYPVRELDEITIKGFNLGSSPWDVKIGTVPLTGVGSTTGGIKGTIPATAVSEELVVTVNGIASFNNSAIKNKSADYNQEKNGVNNDRLDNSRYLYVWKTGQLSNDANSSMNTPFMRMNYNGDRFISYGYYGTTQGSGALRVQKNNGTPLEIGAAYTNRMINTTVAVGSKNPSFYAMGSDLSSLYNGNRGFQLGRSNAAGTASIDTDRGSGTAANNSNAFGAIRLFSMYNSISDRFKIPRITVQSTGSGNRSDTNSDRVLMSFYDEVEHRVQVIYGNIGSSYTNAVDQTAGLGGIVSGFRPTSGTDGNSGAVPVMSTSAVTITDNGAHQGSMYTACGLLSNGVPVIAWYDGINNKLYFSYDRGTVSYPLTTTLADTARVKIDQGRLLTNAVTIDTGKGTDVDLAVDDDDNVHLAYYDVANGGLYYAIISASNGKTNSAMPNTGDIKKAKVDTFLTAGTNLMINVRKEGSRNVPYISYYHNSFTKSKNSIRVAWQKNSTLSDGTNEDKFTGSWEVMTVPADKTPTVGDFVCNGVPPSTSTQWTKPSGSNWPDDIRTSILVGYFTSSYYEGAVLKGDTTTTPSILIK